MHLRPAIVFAIMLVFLAIMSVASIIFGSVEIPLSSLVAVLRDWMGFASEGELLSGHRYIIVDLRLPRTLFAISIGAALSVSGAMMQGLFRNPLADPGLLGVSSGAALGAASVIVLGWTLPVLPNLTLQVAAFVGGVVATGVVMWLSLRAGAASVANMLLAGVAINALCGALTGVLVYVADDEKLRTLTFWTMGSLGGATWGSLPYLLGLAFGPALFCLSLGRMVDALMLGESEAKLLGVNVERLKYLIVFIVCLIMGASVSLTGMIGFVGLVVPHICRLLLGSSNQRVFVGSMILGASLLLTADLLARTIVSPAELPIGIVTSVVGGPFFLFLLYRTRQAGLF